MTDIIDLVPMHRGGYDYSHEYDELYFEGCVGENYVKGIDYQGNEIQYITSTYWTPNIETAFKLVNNNAAVWNCLEPVFKKSKYFAPTGLGYRVDCLWIY